MTTRPTFTPNMERYFAKREELWRTAIEDALIAGDKIRVPMMRGDGVNWDSMAPLKPQERTWVIRELKKLWGIKPRGN